MPVPVPRQRVIPAAESGQAHAVSAPSGPPGEGAALNASALTPADNSTTPPALTGPTGPTDTAAPTALIGPTGHPGQTGPTNLTVLLIEDDPAGSLNVPELLDSAGKPIRVRTARNLTEAQRLLTDDVNCILLDLALPAPTRPIDTGPVPTPGTSTTTATATAINTPTNTNPCPSPSPSGHSVGSGPHPTPNPGTTPTPDPELSVLKHVLTLAPRHAVLALTDSGDAERGAEAVRVGAQDYLFRDELDGRLLSRAIRYAVERKRSDTAERRLTESRLRAQENARLERGLLPTPLLEGSSLRFAARYRPGRSRALLGGDFYDTVRTPDGTVHVMIGDVCGHGPDEAALGVELRIAWRALTFAGLCGDELLSTLQRVLEHERESDEIFATLCTVDIAPDGRRAGLCLAGHPSPLIARHGHGGRPNPPAELLPYDNGGPALGLLPNARWPRTQIELGAAWSLMLYTDGLIEGRIGEGKERLGQDAMVEMVRRQLAQGLRGEELLRAAVNEVRDLNGGELTDDVAVLLLDRDA